MSSKVQKIIQYAEQHCKSNGTRLTDKRKQILAGLLQSQKALSAYELIDYCQNMFGINIPAMSIYRILDFLQEEQLVHKLSLANKYVACSHIACDHNHDVPQFLICGECQRVEEISISKTIMDGLKRNVINAGYQLISPQLEMNCVCDICVKNTA